ncbi:hypothetical protein Clacol_008984 [Clathrus columnatus]|uniref:Uncharacterized protein n=1 Tax=Clathrus columnatus TaxID=1419009 RepID=A0AAV5AJ89_9AGAM|nr:hypothetical protein Clacol_008984 [Clathrus columnatus]
MHAQALDLKTKNTMSTEPSSYSHPPLGLEIYLNGTVFNIKNYASQRDTQSTTLPGHEHTGLDCSLSTAKGNPPTLRSNARSGERYKFEMNSSRECSKSTLLFQVPPRDTVETSEQIHQSKNGAASARADSEKIGPGELKKKPNGHPEHFEEESGETMSPNIHGSSPPILQTSSSLLKPPISSTTLSFIANQLNMPKLDIDEKLDSRLNFKAEADANVMSRPSQTLLTRSEGLDIAFKIQNQKLDELCEHVSALDNLLHEEMTSKKLFVKRISHLENEVRGLKWILNERERTKRADWSSELTESSHSQVEDATVEFFEGGLDIPYLISTPLIVNSKLPFIMCSIEVHSLDMRLTFKSDPFYFGATHTVQVSMIRIHIVTLDGIQETIKALGLADQVNPSVFPDQLEQQVIKLKTPKLPTSFPPPITSQQMMKEGENPSYEEIARLHPTLAIENQSLKGACNWVTPAGLPDYPPAYTYVQRINPTADEAAYLRRMVDEANKKFQARNPDIF